MENNWDKIKLLLKNTKEKEATSLMHLLFKGVLTDVLKTGKGKKLSTEELEDCYSTAFIEVRNVLNDKKYQAKKDVEELFKDKLIEQVFDKEIRKKLKNKFYPNSRIQSECKQYFKKYIDTNKTEFYEKNSLQTVNIFNQTFDSFKGIINQKISHEKTLFYYFKKRLTDRIAIYSLKMNGREDKQWEDIVEKLEKLKGLFLYKYSFLKKEPEGISIHDLFNDAILKLEENIKKGAFKSDSAIETYFKSIFKFRIIDFYRKVSTNDIVSELPELPHEPDFPLKKEFVMDVKTVLKKAFNNLGEKCKKVIVFAIKKVPHEEVAKELGLNSASDASSARYNCMNKLKSNLPNWKGSNNSILEVLILFHDGDF